jgi:hypothetical protein
MYVGRDIHKRACYGTTPDQDGNILKRGKFSNDPEGLKTFIEDVDEASIAMEAGYCWQPLYDSLVDAGHDIGLAHSQRVKAITAVGSDEEYRKHFGRK